MEGMPPETYMERFAWDEAKYPPRRPLKDTVDAITDIVADLEDSLKVAPLPPTSPSASLPFAPALLPSTFSPAARHPCPYALALSVEEVIEGGRSDPVPDSTSPVGLLPFTRGRLPFNLGPLPSELIKLLKVAPVPHPGPHCSPHPLTPGPCPQTSSSS